MPRLGLIFYLLICTFTSTYAQESWKIGTGYGIYTNVILQFDTSGQIPVSVMSTPDHTPICMALSADLDNAGNIRYLTNGVYAYNRLGQKLNTQVLNPCTYTSNYSSSGLCAQEVALFIKNPVDSNITYLFHHSIDISIVTPYVLDAPNKLYLSTIDNRQNGSLGGFVNLNQILLIDTLETGGLVAIKHANGRDWWVIKKKHSSPIFYRLLLTPNGVFGPFTQSVGTSAFQSSEAIDACFSKDGTKYVTFGQSGKAIVFDFDRCAGLLSSPITLNYQVANTLALGASFSPSNRFLYLNNQKFIYQFDLLAGSATAIQNSKIIVSTVDTLCFGDTSVWAGFSISKLAPDGRIYIATWNGCDYLDVIEYPDSAGIACSVVLHAVNLNTSNLTLPNTVNYSLVALPGSVCDSLTTGLQSYNLPNLNLKLAPNPTDGRVVISTDVITGRPEEMQFQLYSLQGVLIESGTLKFENGNAVLVLTQLQNGYYVIRVNKSSSMDDVFKFVKIGN